MCLLCTQTYADLVKMVQDGYREAAARAPAGVLKDALLALAEDPAMGLGDTVKITKDQTTETDQ